jgi:hypothetical protein
VKLPRLDRLVDAVQTNCHIADASHAADMTLCIYLLQMREFFRWEQGIAPLQPLPPEELGSWLAQRESQWAALEGRDYEPLPVREAWFDPFDAAAINEQLRPFGLVYGAGFTEPGRASFFLGELKRAEVRDGLELRVSGCEYARGLVAPPAVLAGSTVLLRQESLARWVCEMVEAWTLKRLPGAFKSALDAHGFDRLGIAAIQRLIDAEGETLVLHELGEFRAGQLLGPQWQALRGSLPSRRTDLYVRAMRDHLADCLVTLPTLLERRADGSLHFWFANLEGVRALLFPQLPKAYAAWTAGDGGAALRDAIAAGSAHWSRACGELIALHLEAAADAAQRIEACAVSPRWILR